MITLPEFLFYAEAEGLTDVVNTRTSKLNAVIRKIRNWEGKIPQQQIERWAYNEGIVLERKDWEYIISQLD